MTVVEVEFLPLLHHAIAKVIHLWQRQFIGG
jgi:hypothetical protein